MLRVGTSTFHIYAPPVPSSLTLSPPALLLSPARLFISCFLVLPRLTASSILSPYYLIAPSLINGCCCYTSTHSFYAARNKGLMKEGGGSKRGVTHTQREREAKTTRPCIKHATQPPITRHTEHTFRVMCTKKHKGCCAYEREGVRNVHTCTVCNSVIFPPSFLHIMTSPSSLCV